MDVGAQHLENIPDKLQVLRTANHKNKEHYNESLGYNIVASFLPIKDDDGQTIAAAGIGTDHPFIS